MVTKVRIPHGDSIEVYVEVERLGVPVDITGSTVRFIAKRRISDADAAAILNSVIPVTDGPGGIAYGYLSSDAAVRGETLHYAVKLSQPSGFEKTLDEGWLTLRADATDA